MTDVHFGVKPLTKKRPLPATEGASEESPTKKKKATQLTISSAGSHKKSKKSHKESAESEEALDDDKTEKVVLYSAMTSVQTPEVFAPGACMGRRLEEITGKQN